MLLNKLCGCGCVAYMALIAARVLCAGSQDPLPVCVRKVHKTHDETAALRRGIVGFCLRLSNYIALIGVSLGVGTNPPLKIMLVKQKSKRVT